MRFISWFPSYGDSRWSEGWNSAIEFVAPSAVYAGKLTLIADYRGRQTVHVAVNGHTLGNYAARNARSDITLDFPPEILRSGAVNRLEFQFPDALLLDNGDNRRMAMALKSVEIR